MTTRRTALNKALDELMIVTWPVDYAERGWRVGLSSLLGPRYNRNTQVTAARDDAAGHWVAADESSWDGEQLYRRADRYLSVGRRPSMTRQQRRLSASCAAIEGSSSLPS